MVLLGLLELPGEIRNLIYDAVVEGTEQVNIRNDELQPHPFAHVCHQLQYEFGTVFTTAFLKARRRCVSLPQTNVKVEDFDLEKAVVALQRFAISTDTKFHIHVHVTKQLYRDDWLGIWPWIEYCDTVRSIEGVQLRPIASKYVVHVKHLACNPFAASHELYIETVPYILRGAARGGAKTNGLEQIDKIRTALCSGLSL